jgi:hypothetical protein
LLRAKYAKASKRDKRRCYGHVGKTSGILRLLPTKNQQEKNIRWAKDYEL